MLSRCAFSLSFFTYVIADPCEYCRDSFEANGICFCDTEFDHNVGKYLLCVTGPNVGKELFGTQMRKEGRHAHPSRTERVDSCAGGLSKTVKQICNDIDIHFGPRPSRASKNQYNDVQCGNGPANDAGDEDFPVDPNGTEWGMHVWRCPGRIDSASTTADCAAKGPTWDLASLYGDEACMPVLNISMFCEKSGFQSLWIDNSAFPQECAAISCQTHTDVEQCCDAI